MTLSPVESRDVRAVPAERYRVNTIDAKPGSLLPAEDKHHIARRSLISGDSYYISIDGGEPIPHVVGLSRESHREITDNEAWIKLHDDGLFHWWQEDGYADDGTKNWLCLGPLDPQPGQLSKSAPQKQPRQKTEQKEKRPSQVMSIRCPKDAADVYGEDGIALLKELIAECGRVMPHREADTPAYFILMDALGWFLMNYKPGEDG